MLLVHARSVSVLLVCALYSMNEGNRINGHLLYVSVPMCMTLHLIVRPVCVHCVNERKMRASNNGVVFVCVCLLITYVITSDNTGECGIHT